LFIFVFLRCPVEYALNPCPVFWDQITDADDGPIKVEDIDDLHLARDLDLILRMQNEKARG
jgi:hypothetical protein